MCVPHCVLWSAAGGASIDALTMENFVATVSNAVLRSMIMSRKPGRARLTGFGTVTKVVELLKTCKKIIVLTGAGVSTSCGIPDFRSKNGIYSMLGHFNLAEPVCHFLIYIYMYVCRISMFWLHRRLRLYAGAIV